ncbi:TetR/AcrR family transcriptional regulator [Actinomadura oligospora]|uniref:TetR/AcrR family transcriptional regulator n=1 Tax=Actinomadura oligospora TaxID=111804 RepID=UPI00047EF0DE|nr:TetR/AcrR family transcriptional regulator [Actinomadura oligospora]
MSPNTDPIAASVWMRPPPKPRRDAPTLSRDQIVAAAIELLDADGLDGMSMRRLGTRLGAGATSAYWYVANKDELLELAMDEVMGEVEIPDPAEVGWREATAACAREYRAAILRHPWMIGLLGVLPAIGPNALRMGDRMVAALAAAGFRGGDLVFASSMLSSYTVGSSMSEVAMRNVSGRAGKSPHELVAELEPYIRSHESDFHSYVGLWSDNKGMDVDKLQEHGFDFGLSRLLDGLETWRDRTGARPA